MTIPNSVTSIGSRAFQSCSSLTTVTIPNSVTSIGDDAFQACSSLTSLTLGNSVTSIGDLAFDYCNSLTSITIPKSVTNIGTYAFSSSSGLTSITVESGNTVYDSRENCNAIIKTSTNELITGCKNTIIPNSVTSIGMDAFSRCTGLTSVTIPESVTSIGEWAFNSCSGLTFVTIGNSVTSIGARAFSFCSGLTSITIPNSVTSIGDWAFRDCSGLTSVTIPNSVTSIGGGAFLGCGLKEVISMIETPFDIDESVFKYQREGSDEYVFTDATLSVPEGTQALYEAAEGWKNFTNIVERKLNPEGSGDIDFGDDDEIDEDTNLAGNVIGNIFYNITDENGSYSSTEGCITVTKPTSDEQLQQLEGQDIFGEDFKNQFTGIVFKIEAGKGTIKVNAETTGNMTLKVKIGDAVPLEMELEGKLKVSFPYEVTTPTYVYIYAGQASAGVKGLNAVATEEGALKIYGIEWTKDEVDDIEAIDNGQLTIDNAIIYNLSGQRLTKPQRGVNIIDGKKVIIK